MPIAPSAKLWPVAPPVGQNRRYLRRVTARPDAVETPLRGGNTTHRVVRVGNTVRCPATPASVTVHAFLQHLNDVGYSGAPRTLGFDDLGRHVVEYVEGPVLMPFVHPEPQAALRRVGRLVRDLHDAAEEFVIPQDAVWNVVIPPDHSGLVIHHDAAPWNLVAGTRWVLIDWDNSGPGSRLWDLAYAAHGFVPLAPETSVEQAVDGLAALADGYGLDDAGRLGLCDLLIPRIMSMYGLLLRGHQEQTLPWCRLWDQGDGEIWLRHAQQTGRHLEKIKSRLLHGG